MGVTVAGAAFDPENPPEQPPAGCVSSMQWKLARQIFADHQPGLDGFCLVCRPSQFYPCIPRRLADLGLWACCPDQAGTPGVGRQVDRNHCGSAEADRRGFRPWG